MLQSRQMLEAARAAALCCVFALHVAGCDLKSGTEPTSADSASPAADSGSTAHVVSSSTNAGASAAAGSTAGAAAGSAASGVAGSASASSPATGSAGSGGAGSAAMASAAGTGGNPSSQPDSRDPDAGTAQDAGDSSPTDAATPAPSDAGAVSPDRLDECSADLAQCLLDDPLDYDGCLRANADQGCPPPDAGTPPATTTPVLDEDGNPISQVCQAELAKCIMREPTPDNSRVCTEMARKCK